MRASFGIWLDSEEVLFETMTQYDIDPFTVEQICEEKLDSSAEIVHSALLHSFVHDLEYKVFIDYLLLNSIVESIELQSVEEDLLEGFVGHWRCGYAEVLVVGLTFVVHGEFVQ